MAICIGTLALAVIAPLQVTVSVPSATETRPIQIEVEVLRSAGAGSSGEFAVSRRLTVEPGAQRRIEIPLGEGALAEGLFRVEARAPGYWSQPVGISLPGDALAVALRLWPTARVAISLDIEKEAPKPGQLHIHFRGTPEEVTKQLVPEGVRKCPIEGERAVCEVPVGRLDWRIEAKGFVPVYVWSHRLTGEGRHVLGPLRLRRGTSIAGFVRTEEGKPARDAAVEALTPSGQRIGSRRQTSKGRTNPIDIDRLAHPLQARTNDQGFFQIVGLEAGDYQVGAHSGALAALASVRVEPGAETRLADFLILGPPLQLEIAVDPPTPPGGTWSLKLVRLEPFPGQVCERAVPAGGSTTLGPVGKGRYSVEVWNGAERWFIHTLSIEQAPGPVVIRLPIVHVRGELTLGGKPLSGEVIFGGRGGPREISMAADTEGRFAGTLPNPGHWVVNVEAATPPIRRALRRLKVEAETGGEASVRIDLPDTVLSGRVVDERGAGVERALVNVKPQTVDDTFFQVQTEPDGRFALHGLPEGSLTLVAQHSRRSSDVASTRVEKDARAEVTLALRSEVRVKGQVRSAAGTPLPGATLSAFPEGVPSTWSLYYNTDPQGQFELTLPAGTREMSVFFWADGHAQQSMRVSVPDGPLNLKLDQDGGTLVLEFERELDLKNDVDAVPVVVHGGARISADLLYMYVLRRGVLTSIPPTFVLSSITLPQMAAGEYSLCSQSLAAILANIPVEGPCERGILPAGGELLLKLPAAVAQR